MEGEAPFRRVYMKSRRSRSFSGFLGGYPSIFQGPTSRLGETEYEEGEESEEEEEDDDTEVEAALEGAPEAFEASNLALSNKPLVSQAEPNSLDMMEKMTRVMGRITQSVSPGTIKEP
ncbi:hypothetical protein O181_034955 [Austropuccinia psidii MF-1]|uniref:Uncharacterized protein n=1 Tax=Austropuccinia psidii MF-1 TaxID=1389203 RepID=A0A9Q3D3X4_9BASI|nr:hypothetical protein [Austropuccinia psidii MF-1]